MIVCLCILLMLSILSQGGMSLFTKDRTQLLKAVLPWAVILHHLSLRTNMIADFNEVGVYAVGLFFFISGFGLEKKKERISVDITQLPNRLTKLLLPLVVPIIFYFALIFLGGSNVTRAISNSLRDWCIILPYTWYVLNLLIFYIIYYILSWLIKDTKGFIISIAIAIFVISILLMLFDSTSAHYSSNFAFIAGIIYCHIEGNVIKHFSSKKSIWVLMLIVIIATYLSKHPFRLSSAWNVPLYSMAVIALISRIPFQNRCIDFVAKYSYELYICQSIAFVILNKLSVSDNFIYILLALPLCLIIAIICHHVTLQLQQLLTKK